MTDIIEVVFENVDRNNVFKLLSFLVRSSEEILGVNCSENITMLEGGEISEKGLEKFLNFDGGLAVFVNVEDMSLENIVLPKVYIRLLKYESQYDIEFSFYFDELKGIGAAKLISELHGYVKRIAMNFNVPSFFGGMEPASDEDTRYFTNEELGPLAV